MFAVDDVGDGRGMYACILRDSVLALVFFFQRLFEPLREVSDEFDHSWDFCGGVAGDFEIAVGPVFAAGFEVVAGVGF